MDKLGRKPRSRRVDMVVVVVEVQLDNNNLGMLVRRQFDKPLGTEVVEVVVILLVLLVLEVRVGLVVLVDLLVRLVLVVLRLRLDLVVLVGLVVVVGVLVHSRLLDKLVYRKQRMLLDTLELEVVVEEVAHNSLVNI